MWIFVALVILTALAVVGGLACGMAEAALDSWEEDEQDD